MAVNDVYRLRVVCRRSSVGVACINDFYFKQTLTTILDSPGEDLVQAWEDDAEVPYTSLFTNFLGVVQYQVAKAPLFLTEHQKDVAGVAGLLTGDPLPPRTSICVSWRTADLTRRGRRRVYLPPANEAQSSDGNPISSYITACLAFGNLFADASIGDGVTTATWLGMMWSPADQAAKPLLQCFVTSSWRTQRDRSQILLG